MTLDFVDPRCYISPSLPSMYFTPFLVDFEFACIYVRLLSPSFSTTLVPRSYLFSPKTEEINTPRPSPCRLLSSINLIENRAFSPGLWSASLGLPTCRPPLLLERDMAFPPLLLKSSSAAQFPRSRLTTGVTWSPCPGSPFPITYP